MSNGKNQQVIALLESAGNTAPEMTRKLAALGNGNMSTGLIALWKNGQQNGVVQGVAGTAMVFSAGIGIYALVKSRVSEARIRRAILASAVQSSSDIESEDGQIASDAVNIVSHS